MQTLNSCNSIEDRVFRTVMDTISAYGMMRSGDRVLVGVSGGPDSVALFDILLRLSKRLDIRLTAAHLDHCLRGEDARADAGFVRKLAGRMGVPFVSESADTRDYARRHRLSLEEAGRDLRYDFFSRVAEEKGCQRIAVGHNTNDNAEQVLMSLLRGSGPSGMGGIPPVREGIVIRPILDLSRQTILAYLDYRQLDYRTDATNRDTRFLRNRIRVDLLPLLTDEFNPNAVAHIHRFAAMLAAENRWMEGLLESLFEKTVLNKKERAIDLSVSSLGAFPLAARRRLLRRSLLEVKKDLRRVGYSHIESILALAFSEKSSGSVDLPDRIRVKKSGDRLSVVREPAPLRQASPFGTGPGMHFSCSLQGPGTVYIAETGHTIRFSKLKTGEKPEWHTAGHRVAFFDMDKIHFPLVLRNMASGDRFRPLGMGGSQKLKDFFINNKIDRSLRSKIPVVVSGERIIWVAGYRMDESAKIDHATVRFLKAEISAPAASNGV